MEVRKATVDAPKVVNSTFFVRKRMDKTIELAEKFKVDPDKKKRLEKHECPVCFYIDSRIGGAIMCTVQCGLCDEIMQFPSTSTDVLCESCAKRTGLCRHCGSDVNVKKRRKFDFLTESGSRTRQ